MRRCEDERMWRWDVKMRRCFTDPHYWKNPALRRSREKMNIRKSMGKSSSPFWKPKIFRHLSWGLLYILIGGIPTPLKNMSSSVGMMAFPTYGKSKKIMFQTTYQICIYIYIHNPRHRYYIYIYICICMALFPKYNSFFSETSIRIKSQQHRCAVCDSLDH